MELALVSDTVFTALIGVSLLLGASTIGFAVAWMRARERAIRAEERAGLAPGSESRFERLEHAMDAVALEMERMSEGQRFVAKLLAERPPQDHEAAARPARITTPT